MMLCRGVFAVAALAVIGVRAADGDAIAGLSLLEKTVLTGFGFTSTVIDGTTFTILPGASASALCQIASLVPVSIPFDQNTAAFPNINLELMYSVLAIPTSKNWIDGVCTAFITNTPNLVACTSSLNVICSQVEPTTAPVTIVKYITTTTFADITVTDTVTASNTTVFKTVTLFTPFLLPATTVSTILTTSSRILTSTRILEQTSATETSFIDSTVTESQTRWTFTTDPFTVTVKVSVDGTTESITSLTDDISSVVINTTSTVTSCPFTTTTDSTETATVTVPVITGTGTVTVRTRTRTRTTNTTTGTCSLQTVTTVQSSGTVIDVDVDTVTIIVPQPPCPTISPCDREEGCYACPYEFPCGLKGPLERCGIQDPVHGLVLAVSPAHKDNATCVCENVGVGLKPAVINAANQETAFNMLNGCLGSYQYAWIGSWNGVVADSNCLALFVKDLYSLNNQGGATVPPDCRVRLPVLCGPDG